MEIPEVPEMNQSEELLEFVKQLVSGYNQGIRTYDFDARYFLASVVMEAWFLYVKYELKPKIGES